MLANEVHGVILRLISGMTFNNEPHDAAYGNTKTYDHKLDWNIQPN